MTRDEERAIEWECQKVVRKYYAHVDKREFEQAVALFTPDVDWVGFDVPLNGREELLEGLYGALGKSTIRHVLTNTVVDVIDEDHAKVCSYNTLNATHDTTYEVGDSPIPYEGPTFVADMTEDMLRTDEGWLIARRRAVAIFRRDMELIPLETWAVDVGKLAPAS